MKDLAQQALELCWEIEKFPASEHQTATVLKASALHQALAALSASEQPPVASPVSAIVPEGYVLVPREPTPEMTDAAAIASLNPYNPIEAIYKAMLSAAPK